MGSSWQNSWRFDSHVHPKNLLKHRKKLVVLLPFELLWNMDAIYCFIPGCTGTSWSTRMSKLAACWWAWSQPLMAVPELAYINFLIDFPSGLRVWGGPRFHFQGWFSCFRKNGGPGLPLQHIYIYPPKKNNRLSREKRERSIDLSTDWK